MDSAEKYLLANLTHIKRESEAEEWHALGTAYAKGLHGLPVHYAKAQYFFEKAIESSQNLSEVVLDSWLQLGLMFYHGHGVEINYEYALHCFKKIADQAVVIDSSVIQSWLLLGQMYECWDGIPRNYLLAIDYYTRAAQQTIDVNLQAQASLILGNIYFDDAFLQT